MPGLLVALMLSQVTVEPTSFDFGVLPLGDDPRMSMRNDGGIVITNLDSAPHEVDLTIEDAPGVPANGCFTVVGSWPVALDAGAQLRADVALNATAEGEYSATARVLLDGMTSPAGAVRLTTYAVDADRPRTRDPLSCACGSSGAGPIDLALFWLLASSRRRRVSAD